MLSRTAKITLIIKLCKKNVKLSAIFLKTTEKPQQVNGQMKKVAADMQIPVREITTANSETQKFRNSEI